MDLIEKWVQLIWITDGFDWKVGPVEVSICYMTWNFITRTLSKPLKDNILTWFDSQKSLDGPQEHHTNHHDGKDWDRIASHVHYEQIHWNLLEWPKRYIPWFLKIKYKTTGLKHEDNANNIIYKFITQRKQFKSSSLSPKSQVCVVVN